MKRYFLTEPQLLKLLVGRHELAALKKGGVNNWEWYSDSLSDYLKAHNEEDFEVIAAKELEDFECGELATYKANEINWDDVVEWLKNHKYISEEWEETKLFGERGIYLASPIERKSLSFIETLDGVFVRLCTLGFKNRVRVEGFIKVSRTHLDIIDYLDENLGTMYNEFNRRVLTEKTEEN